MQLPRNNYIFNVEDPAEQERLSIQDELITKCMGGVLPSDKDFSHVHDVLDLACGPGAWALALAAKYPEMNITGVDISSTMINYARAQAQIRKANVTFEVMDLRQLEFEENSFDFIHVRLISAALRREDWSGLWRCCYKILRPGGWLRWSESDIPVSSSAAYEELFVLLTKAMHRLGQSFSPTGNTIGLLPYMIPHLLQAGFTIAEQRAYPLDCSAYTQVWQIGMQDNIVIFQLIKPLLIKVGVIEEKDFERLFENMVLDIQQPTFYGLSLMLSIWACKPLMA